MPHSWPSGTTDEKYAGYTDVRAPSGAGATWAFLERYRRSDIAMPCAEAPVPPPAAARVRSVWASVAGRRVRTTVRGRRVTLTLPAGRKRAVRVVLRVRRHGRSRARRAAHAPALLTSLWPSAARHRAAVSPPVPGARFG